MAFVHQIGYSDPLVKLTCQHAPHLAKACAPWRATEDAVKPPMVVCPAFCHPVAECYLESINSRLGRNRAAQAKSPDELRQEPTTMSLG